MNNRNLYGYQNLTNNLESIFFKVNYNEENMSGFFSYDVHKRNIQLADDALSSDENFKNHIKTSDDLCVLAKIVPSHAHRLIEYVLDNPNEFDRLFTNKRVFYSVFSVFPAHRDRLFKHLFSHPEIFHEFYKSDCDIKTAILFFPEYEELFNQCAQGEFLTPDTQTSEL